MTVDVAHKLVCHHVVDYVCATWHTCDAHVAHIIAQVNKC